MFFLSTRSLPFGGGVGPLTIIDETGHPQVVSALTSAMQGKDVLFITHGFNVNQPAGIDCLFRWAGLLQLGNVVVVGMLWPGDSSWAHGIDYPVEGNDAMSSADAISDFLNNNSAGAFSLSFASHSLGARVVLQIIQNLSRSAHRLLLMAGAIDNTCLNDEFEVAAANVESISILASRSDDVLKWLFPAGNFVGGLFSHGSPYVHMALGREGPAAPYPDPNNIRAGWQIPDGWGYGHGNYLPDAPVPAVFPVSVDVPSDNPPLPPGTPAALNAQGNLWQPAWSAAFESTRWPLPLGGTCVGVS